MSLVIECLGPEPAEAALDRLTDLLIDAVESGASVGFLPPLSRDEAEGYWREVVQEIRAGKRLLLVASHDGILTGSVQLELASKPNGAHRAEVQKLMVHTRKRNLGFGRALMLEIEKVAAARHRSLLLLDTRHGDTAEKLYLKMGYTLAGSVPGYARSAGGELHTTSMLYKKL